MRAPRFRDLTADESAAVQAYAARMGRYWKYELSFAWIAASEPGILQALRNELGPAWLRAYKLPKLDRLEAKARQ